MKIALIAFNHPESTITLFKKLSVGGYDTDYYFITNAFDKGTSAFEFNEAGRGVGVFRLNILSAPRLFEFLLNKKLFVALIRLAGNSRFFALLNRFIIYLACQRINRKKYDIINLVGQDQRLLYFHRYLKGAKIVHTLHEVGKHYAQQTLSNNLLNYLFVSGTSIIVHSQAAYNSIIKYENVKENLVSVIPFGLFEPYLFYKPKNKKFNFNTTNILLFYGFIRPYKGLDTLISALEIVSKTTQDYFLIIAGEGRIENVDELIADKRIFLLNRRITNEELVELNETAKIIVCPYTSASQSGIVMTTFLFGKPIIATNVGAFKETVINEENGLLVDANSPESLASAIVHLLTNDQLYNKLVSGSKAFGHHDIYDWKFIVEKTVKIYDRLYEERR